MGLKLIGENISNVCASCGVTATFDAYDVGREFGCIVVNNPHACGIPGCVRIIYRLLRCSGCHSGAVAEIHDTAGRKVIRSFHPSAIARLPIPKDTPDGIASEFREAELCASVDAFRAAAALFRSTLEKVLDENGYTRGTLKQKIDEAAGEHTISVPRQSRAHNKIRDLGNDILHEPWREVSGDEVEEAHQYTQRLIEDFYDDRPAVLQQLYSLQRLSPSVAVEAQ